jgi:hypothetical protein
LARYAREEVLGMRTGAGDGRDAGGMERITEIDQILNANLTDDLLKLVSCNGASTALPMYTISSPDSGSQYR